jgi:hypothetical protein
MFLCALCSDRCFESQMLMPFASQRNGVTSNCRSVRSCSEAGSPVAFDRCKGTVIVLLNFTAVVSTFVIPLCIYSAQVRHMLAWNVQPHP